MKIFDVSLPISEDLPTFPGDPLVTIDRDVATRRGVVGYRLSALTLGSHSGTHVDPPFHVVDGGLKVDQLPLELLIGRARVIEIPGPRIDVAALEELDFTDVVRLLFKTRHSYQWSDPKTGGPPYLTGNAARMLVDGGIKVVGIDTLSVDAVDSTTLEAHRALLGAGTLIIEGLDLRLIEPGDFEMICLPLRIKDGDGAPARVILRQ